MHQINNETGSRPPPVMKKPPVQGRFPVPLESMKKLVY